ncbi:MAG: 3-hydroxyacyl-CoA dehydrogenase NAD-binding domain-containing protein [Candidatus Aminicenantia bacterium]
MNFFKTELKDSGILKIVFDIPDEKVNKFSTPVVEELETFLKELLKRNDIKGAYLISGKKDIFIAGADIDEIQAIRDKEEGYQKAKRGIEIFSLIEKLPFPIVAAIDGACLGGGTEIALFCHFRVASDNKATRIGFPEVNLGILPAWGGNQKLPRLIGLAPALDLILTGRTLDGRRALRMGIVDALYPHQVFEEFVERFLEEVIRKGIKKSKPKKKGLLQKLIEDTPLNFIVFSSAKKRVLQRTMGNYPAPLAIIESMKYGYKKKIEKGYDFDARKLGELINTDVSKNLINIFYMTEAIKKEKGVKGEPKVKDIKRAGVVGAGIMGAGIAYAFSSIDIPLRMRDINITALANGMKSIASIYIDSVQKRRMKEGEAYQKISWVSPTTDLSGFSMADIVVEAVFEDMEVKKKLISELNEIVKDDCIVASNTSSLSITEMQNSYKVPENFVGLHFFNPVHRMPLVEIVRGEKTNDDTIATVFALSKKLGKTPIVVKDERGFLVNRILVPYLNEAILILEEGLPVEIIDRSMKKFGMPMGPIRLLDEVGIDVASKVALILYDRFGERMKPSSKMDKLLEAKLLGKKTGKGFYIFNGRERANEEIYKILQIEKRSFSEEEAVKRMTLTMINEASRCLEEGIAESPSTVDIGMIFGTGFPPFRGGVLRYADSIGLKNVLSELENLRGKYGERFAPSELIEKMAREGKNFY